MTGGGLKAVKNEGSWHSSGKKITGSAEKKGLKLQILKVIKVTAPVMNANR
jgi:hypothetical protein